MQSMTGQEKGGC